MRLRRETGDFQIVLGETGQCTVRQGLKPEQFVGEIIVDNRGVYHVVTDVTPTETGANLAAGNLNLTYTSATGVIAVAL